MNMYPVVPHIEGLPVSAQVWVTFGTTPSVISYTVFTYKTFIYSNASKMFGIKEICDCTVHFQSTECDIQNVFSKRL